MPRGLERPLPPATAGYERLRRMIEERKPGAISIRARRPLPVEGPSAGLLLALVAAALVLLTIFSWHGVGGHML